MKSTNPFLYFFSLTIFVLIFRPLAQLFLRNPLHSLFLSFIPAAIFAPFISLSAKNIRIQSSRRYLQYFLQNMVSQLNIGNTLRFSLEASFAALCEQFPRSPFHRRFHAASQALALRASFSETIPLMSEAFPCPESESFFSLLLNPELLGDKMTTLFRHYEQDLRESRNQRESLQAEQAKALTESISLAAMPPLIIIGLSRMAPEYLSLAYEDKSGQLMLLGAYFLFCLSCFSLGRIFLPPISKKRVEIDRKVTPKKLSLLPKYIKLYEATTPLFLKVKNKEAVRLLSVSEREQDRNLWLKHLFLKRLRFVFYASAIGGTFIYKQVPLVLTVVLFLSLVIFPDYELLKKASERRNTIQDELPDFFSYLLLCLSSGQSLPQSMQIAEHAFKSSPYLTAELALLNRQLENRRSAGQTLDGFLQRLAMPEAGMFLRLLAQYNEGGGASDLHLMSLQIQQFRHVLRERQRKREARQANRYLLPMVLDLLSVMMISLAPIIHSMNF